MAFDRALAVVFCLAIAAGAATAGDLKDWKRHPLVTVPYMAQPPAIDGTVERIEWQAAAQLGPLKVSPEGVAEDLARDVFIGYDDKNLYVAFRLERPSGALDPLVPAHPGRIDNWKVGDTIELALDVGHTQASCHSFVLYANGAYGEGFANPSVDPNWDTPWQQAASRTSSGWQGEIAIPFASFKLNAAPNPGEMWGFDFIEVRRTPSTLLSHWAYRGATWRAFGNLGHLRFGDRQSPAVRFAKAVDAGDGKMMVAFDLVNATGKDCRVRAEFDVRKRKAGVEGGPKSWYDNIESGGEYDRTQVEFEKSTKLEGLLAEASRFYAPVEGAAVQAPIDVPNGQRRSVAILKPALPGEYLVTYNFQSADGAPLLQGVLPFRIETPLSLDVASFWLHSQVIDVRADVRKVKLPGKAQVVFSLLDGAGKALVEDEAPAVPQQERVAGTLSTKDIPAGFYKVQVVVRDDKGTELARNSEAVEKPSTPPWHNNSVGKMEVPMPWTPIQAEPTGKVSVWGRTYDLSQGLPASMVSQGDELLAAPVRVEVTVDGAPLAWKLSALKQESASAGKTVYHMALDSDRATLAGTVTAEFDGFLWYQLKLAPKNPGLKVNLGEIAVDLAGKHARLLGKHKYLVDPVLYPKGAKEAKGGGPKLAASLLPFTPYAWIGDETGGLAWVGEGPIDWKITRPNEIIAVTPGATPADATQFRVRFIDAPATLDKPMRLEFGLQASPIRPMPDERITHLVQFGGPSVGEDVYKSIANAGATCVVFHGGWKGANKGADWGGWPARPRDPAGHENIKKAVAMAHKHGLKVMLYTGWGIEADSDEFKKFGNEFCMNPVENSGFGTYRQAAGLNGCYVDYVPWAIADLVREYGADGVFWDSASNLFVDQNIRIGNGWIDEEGRVRPTFPVRASRELFKRVYSIVHGEIKNDGVCINFGGSIWVINAFADIFHRGEGIPMHVKTLMDAWNPLEDFRAEYSGRPFGLTYLAMNKNFKRLPMTVNKHNAVTLLHGWHTKSSGKVEAREQTYGVDASPHASIWKAKDWLPMDATRRSFFYYDERKAVLPANRALLSSAFVSGDGKRALIVVSNLEEAPVKGALVKIDRALMQLAAGPLKLEDALLATPVKMNGDAFTLDIEPERFRLLKLSVTQ